ncbi:MAG TPA: class I SAM-dependent methyltransferase [Pyrinomonadaceae bacterium]|jgi:SAM-dependent methyltransferase
MSEYSEETYGDRVASVYDQWFPSCDPDAITFLAELADGGKVLELGIGTGRFALPLAAKNVEVHGVDAADSMIAQLRTKPNSDKVIVTKGNFADVPVDGEFQLIYVVFNTIFALPSQEAQVRCFRNVASHLAKKGCFVIEAFVPDVARFGRGRVNWPTTVTTDRIELDVGEHDSVTQRVVSQKVVITDGGVRLFPIQIRYAWPSELDLMAQLAGLRLRERFAGWRHEPFTSESQKHISVYEWKQTDAGH